MDGCFLFGSHGNGDCCVLFVYNGGKAAGLIPIYGKTLSANTIKFADSVFVFLSKSFIIK